jgi:acyl-protein synthetase LuxE
MSASARESTDDRLGEAVALSGRLMEAARAWADGAAPGPEVAESRRAALLLNHERYARLVPAYRALAAPIGATGPVDLGVVVDNLVFAGLFKSYDPALPAAGDFAALTEWLSSVSTRALPAPPAEVRTIGDWRAWLRGAGVFLSFSSGTSGRLSFVPRDLPSWKALLTASASYADTSWRQDAAGQLVDFDCLVAGPRGEGIGLLDAGNGLARIAARAHFLFDRGLGADAVSALSAGGGAWIEASEVEEAYRGAAAFLRTAAREDRRVLVFGAPFQVRRLCAWIAEQGQVAAAEGSVVVTGGGWKAFGGERLRRADLTRLIADSLAIPPERFIDAYSTSELSCALSSCAQGRYHVPPILEPVVLDEALTGTVGGTGEGLLAFLDPLAFSYPGFVITGDRGVLGEGRCGCGKSGAFIDGEIERAPGMEVRGCGGVLESLSV